MKQSKKLSKKERNNNYILNIIIKEKLEMEDEYHFLNICPAYQEKRCSLLDYVEKEYRIKISRMSPDKIFMFLITPPSGNTKTKKLIAKHHKCFEKRKGETAKSKYSGT